MKRAKAGFTLIELLFVIAILGILTAIAVPKFSGVMTAANTAKLQSDLRALDGAIQLYDMDHQTALASSIGAQLDDYLDRVPHPPEGAGRLADGTAVAVAKDAQYTIAGTAAGMQHAQVLTDKGAKELADFIK